MSDTAPAYKDLHEVVLDALDLHASSEIPRIDLPPATRRLVIASGNALPTAKIIFADQSVCFADESSYRQVLDRHRAQVDSAVVISASGKKHAPPIVDDLTAQGLDCYLITCDGRSPAASRLAADHVIETTSNADEPLTYNTSTYLGMILAKTGEDVGAIKQHLLEQISPRLDSIGGYQAYYLILLPQFDLQREMFVTKFDELFGGRINGRCYTWEQTMHAKTVVPWEQELFISFGWENRFFGSEKTRLEIPLPAGAGPAAMLAVGYYVIGRIQAASPPWFRQHVEAYRQFQGRIFRDLADG